MDRHLHSKEALGAVLGSLSVVSRKRCDLENAETLRLFFRAPKHRCDLSAICSVIFWRFFCDVCSKACSFALLGCTPKGAYSTRGRSRHLLETPFSEPLLKTLLRCLFNCKTHSKPPSKNPFPGILSRTFSEPFLERCVAVRPLRRSFAL